MSTTPPQPHRAVVSIIQSGAVDGHFDDIVKAVVARRKFLEVQANLEFATGDYVVFSDGTPDDYRNMRNVTGVVVGKARGESGIRVKLDPDTPHRSVGPKKRKTFKAGETWTVPATWVAHQESSLSPADFTS